MPQLNILVAGGGIAGSVVAYWLGKAGIQVTVVERAPELRKSGQGVDVRGRGLDIIRLMGVEEAVKSKTTEEAGLVFVDDNNSNLITIDAQGDQNFTAEIEIIRSDLAKVLYDAALSTGNVKYEFDVSITGIRQSETAVDVDLSNGQSRVYDLIIAADGFNSKTRSMILGPDRSKAGFKSLDAFVAYFSVPSEKQDGPRSRWFQTVERRAVMLRPLHDGKTSAYLTLFSDKDDVRDARSSGDIDVQKAFLTKKFSNVGWETERLLKEMQKAGPDDFYFQEVAQVKLDPFSWHEGRCALTGDAAYCPSAFTGMGTTLAIIGAYVLAGEIVAQTNKQSEPSKIPTSDIETAFRNYETILGDYVKYVQKIPLGGYLPLLINPQTAWGLWILRTILWTVDRSGLVKLLSSLGAPKTEGITLPDYNF